VSNQNIVYVLTNLAMPGLCKIGKTTTGLNPDRVTQLSFASGVPSPFEVYYAAKVDNATEVVPFQA
jgi:hypothetical protein